MSFKTGSGGHWQWWSSPRRGTSCSFAACSQRAAQGQPSPGRSPCSPGLGARRGDRLVRRGLRTFRGRPVDSAGRLGRRQRRSVTLERSGSSERKAVFTDSDVGYRSATSGSSTTTFVDSRYRSRYLPLVAPEKSVAQALRTLLHGSGEPCSTPATIPDAGIRVSICLCGSVHAARVAIAPAVGCVR